MAGWLRLHPERSDNWIAEDMQVSKNTVAAVREELEATCQIDRLTELVGKDGRTRPRRIETGPVIDPEFADILPSLTEREAKGLERSILQHGIIHALKVWAGRNILLDGHERLRIARKHGLSYEVQEVDLPDRDAAIDWIINNQLMVRNLSRQAEEYYWGLRYNREKQAVAHDRNGQE